MLLGMKKKTTGNKNRISPLKAFFITFTTVVGCGLLFMFGYFLLSGSGTAFGSADQESGFLRVFWEAIPEDAGGQETDGSGGDGTRYGALLADEEAMREGNIYAMPNRKEGVVSLGFVGDILFDDEYAVMANLLNRGVTIENGISEELLAQMQGVDILMANNEFAYTDRGTPTEGKTYTFRADTESVGYLKDMGVDIVSLANNHCYDFGETGLLDTLTTLEEAKVPYVGAGRNLEEAARPVYFISGDIKIAIVSATQIERLDYPDTKGATDSSPGVFRCWNPEKLYEVVTEAKENSDFVIVFIHWGTENVAEPDWAQLEQAPKLAEAGADLVIGAHPHCLQGIQYYGDVPVVYSLGNFWFNSKTVDTCLFKVNITKDGLESMQFIPAIQKDSRTDLAYGSESQRIISYMESISYGATIDSQGFVGKR
ncbi:MAG: CapA family protein [Lachnospiraceae bacterium]|nr:CapA family protein [Lachnospiraceae bacterium]